jgi:hypothetical protein
MPGQHNNLAHFAQHGELCTIWGQRHGARPIRGRIIIENLGQFGRRLDGCYGELYGRLFPFHMSNPSWFVLQVLPEHGHPGMAFQIRRMRIRHPSLSFYVDVRWSPERGLRVSIDGLKVVPGKQEIMTAEQWVRAMFSGRPRGRPVGSTGFRDRDHFLAVVCGIIRELRHQGHRPTQAAVAKILSRKPGCPGGDDSQLRQWLRYYGLTWESLLHHPLSIPPTD